MADTAGLTGVASTEQAIEIFKELRKGEVMQELANSDAHLYFTPAECDLRLGMTTVSDGGKRKTSEAKRERSKNKKIEASAGLS